MQKYYYTAEVIQTFRDTITICVEAEHAGIARKTVRKALETFPKEVEGDSIKSCFIENRDKVGSEIIDLTRTIRRPVDEET